MESMVRNGGGIRALKRLWGTNRDGAIFSIRGCRGTVGNGETKSVIVGPRQKLGGAASNDRLGEKQWALSELEEHRQNVGEWRDKGAVVRELGTE